MTDSEAARAAIGALPPNPPQSATVQNEAGQQTQEVAQPREAESATAPTEFGSAELQAAMAGLDPFAMVGTIKSLVSLGVKVLGLVSKFPGPQQAAAQTLLKVLDEVNSLLSRIP